MPPTPPNSRHVVTAVVVTHDGVRMLPGLVRALRGQTYPIQRAVGVDTGSTDRSGVALAELIGPDCVFGMDRDASFGEAVRAALGHRAARTGGPSGIEWIWLLHDDCEPAPDALERLLRAASRDRGIGVVGPKVLDLSQHRVLRETGVTMDRAGRRVTGIEPGEIDQGQHDGNRGVLAVGSAGMLVRRDVWERTGGFDKNLTMFRDDVDFCWRVHAAGFRVQVVTDAVVYHRELAGRHVREVPGGQPRRLDRRNALYVFAANLPFLAALKILGGCVAGSLVRAGYFLITKQTQRAADHLAAVSGVLGHPGMLWRARRTRARRMRPGYAAVRGYLPHGRTLARLAEAAAGMITTGPPRQAGGHQAIGETDDEQFTDEQSLLNRVLANHAVQLVAALAVLAVVAERRLIGSGILGGGSLVPAWSGATSLWQEYLAGFHASGIGSTAQAPPYLAAVAVLASVLAGKSWLAVDVLLLGCVPLAGMTAYLAARRVTTSLAARIIGAASYALLPVATGAIAAGRLGTAVAFALLPLIGLTAARMVTARPSRPAVARRAAWGTGLLVAIGAAFVPLLWPLAAAMAVACAGWSLVSRRWPVVTAPAVSLLDAVVVAVAPLLILMPWSFALLRAPGGFLGEAGIARTGLSDGGLPAHDLLMLSPGGPGLPPAWVTAGFAVAVAALLLPAGRRRVRVAGWLVALAGFAAAVVVSRMTVGADGARVSAWPGAELAIAGAGLVLAALPAFEWLATLARQGGSRRLAALLTLGLAASAPLLAGGYWLARGVQGPVQPVSGSVLPAFVASASAGQDRPRTLVLRPSDGMLSYTIVRAADPSLGAPELAPPAGAAAGLDRAVATLAAANGNYEGDAGQALGGYGIKWVLLPAPVDSTLAQRLNAAAGLISVSTSQAYDLWQVAGTVARLRVDEPGGTVVALSSGDMSAGPVTAPAAGGTLVLAEPAGGWTATLNGHALTSVVIDGWEQGFTLPAGGGTLVVTHHGLGRDLLVVAELIALLAVCVLALPGKRPDAAVMTDTGSREPSTAVDLAPWPPAGPDPVPRRAIAAAGSHRAARHGRRGPGGRRGAAEQRGNSAGEDEQ